MSDIMVKLDLVVAVVDGGGGGSVDATGVQDVVEAGALTSVLKHQVVRVVVVVGGVNAARARRGGAVTGEKTSPEKLKKISKPLFCSVFHYLI